MMKRNQTDMLNGPLRRKQVTSVLLCVNTSLLSAKSYGKCFLLPRHTWFHVCLISAFQKSTFWTTAEISWWCNFAPSLPVNLLVNFFFFCTTTFCIPWCVSWLQNILHTGPLSLFGSGTISVITQHNIILNVFYVIFPLVWSKENLNEVWNTILHAGNDTCMHEWVQLHKVWRGARQLLPSAAIHTLDPGLDGPCIVVGEPPGLVGWTVWTLQSDAPTRSPPMNVRRAKNKSKEKLVCKCFISCCYQTLLKCFIATTLWMSLACQESPEMKTGPSFASFACSKLQLWKLV